MPYPDKPNIQTSYTAYEQSLGDGSLPGQELDNDFANLADSVESLNDFVRGITRSDGALKNGIVTAESLAASVRIGIDPPTTWATATAYTVGRSTVFSGFGFYVCAASHTSGASFAVDLGAGRWTLLADLTPPTGTLLRDLNLSDVTDAATARTNLGVSLGNLGITASAAELNILDGVTATTTEINVLDGVTATASEINAIDGVTATGTALIRAADAAAGRTLLEAPSEPNAGTGAPGEVAGLFPSVGAAAVLPAGGRWLYALTRYNSGVTTSAAFGVAIGGTTVGAAVAGQNWVGFAWRTR